MVKFALKVVILAVAFYVLTKYQVLPGLTVDPNPNGLLGEAGTYLWIGLLFGVVNALAGPVLRLLSLPFVVLTLGLFLLVVNAAMLGLVALMLPGFQIATFWTAVLAAIIVSIVSWIGSWFIGSRGRVEVIRSKQ